MVNDKANMNTSFAVFELIQEGHYIEAQQKCQYRFPFIQDLIEYASLKRIAESIVERKKIIEVAYGYSN